MKFAVHWGLQPCGHNNGRSNTSKDDLYINTYSIAKHLITYYPLFLSNVMVTLGNTFICPNELICNAPPSWASLSMKFNSSWISTRHPIIYKLYSICINWLIARLYMRTNPKGWAIVRYKSISSFKKEWSVCNIYNSIRTSILLKRTEINDVGSYTLLIIIWNVLPIGDVVFWKPFHGFERWLCCYCKGASKSRCLIIFKSAAFNGHYLAFNLRRNDTNRTTMPTSISFIVTIL